MDAWLILLAIIGVMGWLLHGAYRSRIDDARKEADKIDEAMQQNHLADTDDDIDKRVRSKFGKR